MQVITAAARGAPESFADLVEEVGPSVVNITTMTKVATQIGPQGVVPEGSPFEDLFRDFGNRQGGPRNATALGSGFVISEDGYIVTNNHVIDGADEIMVEFRDGSELPAKLIGRDKNVDIALLKVEAKAALPFVDFGDSDTARVGDWVMAVGNPLGQGFSVSAGIISARNRELSGAYDDFIQTDAAINRGNSGGPLFNMDGDVIGVNTAILSPSGGSIGIGFSMAAKVVDPVVKQLKEFGEVRRGWLGVNIGDVTEDMAQALGMDTPAGAIIRDVFDGPAKDAGLLTMDVIVMFDGQDVADAGALVRLVGAAPVGKAVKTIVLRDGTRKTIDVVLGQRPEPEDIASNAQPAPEAEMILGMGLATIDDAAREKYTLEADVSGLVVTQVDAESPAAAKGIQEGDVITDAGQKAVTSVDEFQAQIDAAVDAGRQSLLVLVRREGQPRFIVLNLE
ncbi:Do family serine endopeptidase [Rhodobacteraceae bacterium]|nr:Do family serine endopeptidase [Paracoccaceae bacterium]